MSHTAHFACTEKEQFWQVPIGVTTINVELNSAGASIAGDHVSGILSVTPGETLTIVVGHAGDHTHQTIHGCITAIKRGTEFVVTAGGGSSALKEHERNDPPYIDNLTDAVVKIYGGAIAYTNGNLSITYSPVMCFVHDSNLLTPSGYKEAKDIKTGDLLVTSDKRTVHVKVYTTTLTANRETAPFMIPKNSVDVGCPTADLRLSPWHAFQMNSHLWMMPMTFSELHPGAIHQYDVGKTITYYHFEAPDYFRDNFLCDGTVVESYGGHQLDAIKGHIYTHDATHGAYTRITGEPTTHKLMV